MKKNQLNVFRKRMQKSFADHLKSVDFLFMKTTSNLCDNLVNHYHSYCRKMLLCTISACLFNVFFVVVIILCSL